MRRGSQPLQSRSKRKGSTALQLEAAALRYHALNQDIGSIPEQARARASPSLFHRSRVLRSNGDCNPHTQ
eukprot:7980524-Alexandrium_andersonii.AAC.1